MAELPAEPALPVSPLGKRLADLGITAAAIVDDAYDIPTLENLNPAEVEAFWGAIERNDALIEALADVAGVPITRSTDIENPTIEKLWRTKDDGSDLARHTREKLFSTVNERRTDLDGLEENLHKLGLDVKRVDSTGALPDPNIKLVFLDYYLGTSAEAVTAAKVRAREIYNRGEESDKPFIVLMSSEANVETYKESFRDESELLAGLFAFVHKPQLKDPQALNLRLATWAIGLPERHAIQRFVQAIEASVKLLPFSFMRTVRGLGLEDYAYVQRIALQKDGHPLGDYMLWLFAGLLSHRAFERDAGVKEKRRELDKLAFTELLPSNFTPSEEMVEVHCLALADPDVDALGVHPLAYLGNQPNKLPYLRMGDVLVSKKKDVWLIANAACDLAFAPGSDRDDPKRSILLIPGEFAPLDRKPKSGEAKTDVFDVDGEANCIVWNYTHAELKAHGDIEKWVKDEGCIRIARLRAPYVQQIQQSYAQNLTRVGTPVPPPRYEMLDVEVYHEKAEGGYVRLSDTIANGARAVSAKDGNYFHLNLETVAVLLGGLGLVANAQAAKRALAEASKGPGWTQRVQAIEEKIQMLTALGSEHAEWIKLVRQPRDRPLKPDTEVKVLQNVLSLWWDCEVAKIAAAKVPLVLITRPQKESKLQIVPASAPADDAAKQSAVEPVHTAVDVPARLPQIVREEQSDAK